MFPAVDFSLVTEQHDPLWTLHHRETKEEICARGMQFLQWVMSRPERNIAVSVWRVCRASAVVMWDGKQDGKQTGPMAMQQVQDGKRARICLLLGAMSCLKCPFIQALRSLTYMP